MGDKVTSHDVARRAGVSRTTVSMVLNRSDAVILSAETREKVFEAARELGYKPNSVARMLARGNTETIGLVISDPGILRSDAFVPQLLYGISQVNREHGYHVLLEGLEANTGRGTYESLVEARRIDGLVVLNPRTDDPELKALIDREFPVVLAGTIRHPQEYSVNFSTSGGIAQAVELLIGLGHTRIGMVTFSPRGLVATDVRIASLRKALAAHAMTLDDADIEAGNFSSESGYAATGALLARRPDLTAIFAGNDTIAIGVISAASSFGFSVPDDLSVVGFDNLPFSGFLMPPLTTIHVDAVAQGNRAADMLIRLLKGETIEHRRITVPTDLIVRKSCAPPRGRG